MGLVIQDSSCVKMLCFQRNVFEILFDIICELLASYELLGLQLASYLSSQELAPRGCQSPCNDCSVAGSGKRTFPVVCGPTYDGLASLASSRNPKNRAAAKENGSLALQDYQTHQRSIRASASGDVSVASRDFSTCSSRHSQSFSTTSSSRRHLPQRSASGNMPKRANGDQQRPSLRRTTSERIPRGTVSSHRDRSPRERHAPSRKHSSRDAASSRSASGGKQQRHRRKLHHHLHRQPVSGDAPSVVSSSVETHSMDNSGGSSGSSGNIQDKPRRPGLTRGSSLRLQRGLNMSKPRPGLIKSISERLISAKETDKAGLWASKPTIY